MDAASLVITRFSRTGSGPRDTIRKSMQRFKDRVFFEAVTAALYECADAVRAEAVQSISRGSVSGKNHVPSAPGEPPNRDTGHLQSQIETSQPKPMTARVTSKAEYAAALEFGTSKAAARPYMRPARDKVRPRAVKILRRRVKDATKRRNT